jgi:hypothetical protein
MNATHLYRNRIRSAQRFQNYRQRRRFRHDPWLVFNMAAFNFDGSWNRLFDPLRASASGRC